MPFASSKNPILREPLPELARPIPVDIPCDSRMVESASGERLIPTAPPAIAIAQWAFTAELIGACRRKNRQLAVYLSIFLDEGHRRLKRTSGLLFEPDLRPPPVARGQYARDFLAKVRTALAAVRTGEIAKIRTAAGWLREASAAKRKIVRNFQGHLPPVEAGMPGDVGFFTTMVHSDRRRRGRLDPREPARRRRLSSPRLSGERRRDGGRGQRAGRADHLHHLATAPAPRWPPVQRHLYVDPHWPVTDALP